MHEDFLVHTTKIESVSHPFRIYQINSNLDFLSERTYEFDPEKFYLCAALEKNAGHPLMKVRFSATVQGSDADVALCDYNYCMT